MHRRLRRNVGKFIVLTVNLCTLQIDDLSAGATHPFSGAPMHSNTDFEKYWGRGLLNVTHLCSGKGGAGGNGHGIAYLS